VRRTLTIEAWEDTLLSVAETLKRHKGKERIRNLEAYLVGIFQHRLSRAIVREKNFAGTVECLPSSQDLAELRHARDEDWPMNLQKQILVKELLRVWMSAWRRLSHSKESVAYLFLRRVTVGRCWGTTDFLSLRIFLLTNETT